MVEVPRSASKRWQQALMLGPVLLILVVVVSVWLALDTDKISLPAARNWEIGGVALALLMLAGSTATAFTAWRDLGHARQELGGHTPTVAETQTLDVAARELARAWYRLVGKAWITFALSQFATAKNSHVLHWLQHHPLAIYLVLLNAMFTFAVVDFVDLIWRRSFTQGREQQNGGDNHG